MSLTERRFAAQEVPGAIVAPGTPVPQIRPHRTLGQFLVPLILAALAFGIAYSLVTNPNWRWGTVGSYLFDPRILAGLANTLLLTVIAMTLGIILGVVIAILGESRSRSVRGFAAVYTWFFRGTPVFVQIIFWYNIAALYPTFSLPLPIGGGALSVSTNAMITPFIAAILALGLNESAYMAEVIRGGLLAVDSGQTEAGLALGMRWRTILWRIVLPQAMRVIIPPTGNQVINMLKVTSLVSVIAFTELLYSAQLIYSSNFLTIPLLLVASFWYLVCTSILTVGQHYLERHFAPRTAAKSAEPSEGALPA